MDNGKTKKVNDKQNEPSTPLHKTLTIVGIIMCVILVPMLIVNCTLILKSFINKDEVPTIGGYMPLIVLTDSMYPEIKSGDIIICRTVDAKDIEVGDVISFFDPAGNGSSIVTHQVIEIMTGEDGKLSFRTKGTNNNTEDKYPVPEDRLVGRYTDTRIGGAGNVALFMQTTAGLIVCVIVPCFLLIGYDILRRKMYDKKNGNDVEALMAELEALKAQQAAAQAAAQTPAEAPTEAPAEASEEQTSDNNADN